MVTIMNGLPDNVIGILAEGKVTASDYKDVITPAIENKLKVHKEIRLLYDLGPRFEGFEVPAMIDDAMLGIQHISKWRKIALVSDYPMINAITKFFGHLLSGEVRIFKNADMQQARQWVAA